MTAVAKPEHPPAANRQVHSVLAPLPEQELIHLLKSVKALRKDLRLIFSSNREADPAVKAGHDLLKTWSDALGRILSAKQARDTSAQLHEWDNEGGSSRSASQRQPVNTTDGEKASIRFCGCRQVNSSRQA